MYLPEPDLWLDPWDAKTHAFISHAHADHFARHESVICSEVTSSLLRNRFRLASNRVTPLAFHVPVTHKGFRLRLLPAGHIPGSAMLHVTRIADNATLLYTGDFKNRRSRTTEAAGFLSADTLVMETTFGLPGFVFPSPMEVESEILRFVDDAFSDGDTPVLLGYSLGKAQEALALLEEHGIPALLHPAAAAMTRACREAGVPGLPEPVEFDGHAPPGHVVIAPPHSVRTRLLRGLKSKRTAMLSGWAMQPGSKYRHRVDRMIPFSDHADHPGLMECIQRVRPRRILTVHGYAREFAAELRARNIDAWCAGGGDQLELPIHHPAKRQNTARTVWHKRVVCPLADFSDLCRLVGETGSRVAKTRFLTTYLKDIEKDDDLRVAVRWLCREPAPARSSTLDATILRHALAAIPGAKDDRHHETQLIRTNLPRAARTILQDLQLQPEAADLTQAAAFVEGFQQASASMPPIQRLTTRLATLHPSEGETIVRLLLADPGLGIDAPMVEQAIAAAFKTDLEHVRRTVQLTGDPGQTAVLARQRRLDDAQAGIADSAEGSSSTQRATTRELPFH